MNLPYFKPHFPHIVCMDGTTLSVQASETHYCTPRDNKGPYTHVEVGYPSAEPPTTWKEYQDGDCAVWGYIPVGLVQDFIEAHGGVALGKTLANCQQ